jgi:ABC-2 type transport system ATP-binding protein/lipopolysaccharide transport system ATP-binding protein
MGSIDLKNVSVFYPLYSASGRSLKHSLLQRIGGRLGDDAQGRLVIEALRDVNLSLRPGDRIGLVGHNGAGKSTLLRVLAGIYEPSVGEASIEGRVSSLLDITLGMDFEATGYENIFMRGVIMGMTFNQIEERIPDIEAFSELGAYLNIPVRNYSSGMQLRLAFAISTAVQTDIVLLDEVVSVGDAAFIVKAEQRIVELTDQADIFVLASHVPQMIERVCDKVIVLNGGRIVEMADTPRQVATVLGLG